MSIKLTNAAVTLLAAIINATDANGENSGCGYVAASYPAGKSLIENGLIEVNESVTNPQAAGEFGARPTAAGREYAKTGAVAGDTSTEAPKTKPSFEIETGIALPGKTRAPIQQLYPFDKLVVGGSFFVSDASVKSGDAFKSLQSTVASTNSRHAVETGEFRPNRKNPEKQVAVTKQVRQFELRRWTQEDGTKGARVFEVAVDAE